MPAPTVHLICNAHLDPVWQWRWEEGCAETLSTFGTAVELLEEHPNLIFNHNEAVLYQWVKEYNPVLFGKIQSLVRAGRWAISGGWYLQPDVNMPGTESLIRHIAVGRRFFREEFGVEPQVAYNFDSFGHSAGLPQLLCQAGFQMYIHMRPQPPELALPSDLYRWRGLDGSEILALRIVVGLYHTERHNIEQRLQEGVALALQFQRDIPVFWGIGDHGGGPTREDLRLIDSFITREKRVRIIHSTPERLLEALRDAGVQAPLVTSDLQRVFTGCYTSLSRLKRQAVRSLATLTQTELLRTLSWWELGQSFPAAQFEGAWRDHLFNDFHDILPGSCIEPAEQDALGLYAKVDDTCRRLRLGAATAFNSGKPHPCYIPVTILNANPAARTVPVEVECMLDLRPKWSGTWHLRLFALSGQELPCQEEQPESLLPFNGWRRKVAFMAQLPAAGVRHYKLEIREGTVERPAAPAAVAHRLDPKLGLVTSLQVADGRECLAGAMLKPLVVEDLADAWGADHWSYRRVLGEFEFVPGTLTRIAEGPIRTITESIHRYNQSRLVLHTIAYASFPALEFRLRLHWQEERCRLKLSIPTLFKSSHVQCEVPGGVWQRPADGQEHVHRRWLMIEGDLGDSPVGLAVVHQGLHGFDFQEGELRLSLLRSAAYCHEQGFKLGSRRHRKYMDQGVHELRLLVLAGAAAELRSRLPALADWLAGPPAVYSHLPIGTQEQTQASLSALLEAIPPNLQLLACKPSWDGQAVILRLQECCGEQGKFSPLANPEFTFRPYQLKTLRFDRTNGLKEVPLIAEM